MSEEFIDEFQLYGCTLIDAGTISLPDYDSVTPANKEMVSCAIDSSDMVAAFARHDPRDRIPWYGPDMSARSGATARLMETWAHAQDVADALGISPRTLRYKLARMREQGIEV